MLGGGWCFSPMVTATRKTSSILDGHTDFMSTANRFTFITGKNSELMVVAIMKNNVLQLRICYIIVILLFISIVISKELSWNYYFQTDLCICWPAQCFELCSNNQTLSFHLKKSSLYVSCRRRFFILQCHLDSDYLTDLIHLSTFRQMTSHRSFWIRMASDSLNKNLNTYFMRLSLEEAVTVVQFSRDFISPLAQCALCNAIWLLLDLE